ncbi:MAG: NAD(+)/NADH kinase [Cardiobacteriaceae bacterium]|nr:NAD(+)/NADH kinase [Cardiobacteriaceae bacterium]
MTLFQHIGIIGRYGDSPIQSTIKHITELLEEHGIRITYDARTLPYMPQAIPCEAWEGVDLVLTVGGDGTFLSAGRAVAGRGIPIVGVNTGRLGYLADIAVENLDRQLREILHGQYTQEERGLLRVEVERVGEEIKRFQVVNDVVIHKRHMARMIELDVYHRAHYLCHYRADGLIISTPTGSTAYAISAGGPLIEPTLPVHLLVPICPHTLNQRPMVIDRQSALTVRLSKASRDNIQITLDGQEELMLQSDDVVHIGAGDSFTVIHPIGYQFQQRLRTKLNWGIAPEDSA